MDSDTELTFFPDNAVHMFEWGFTLQSYRGTYRVNKSGEITVHFKNFPKDWPTMKLGSDSKSLLLHPADSNIHFVMGTRGGATMPGEGVSYWPFRMLTGDDEKSVLKMIEERRR